MFRCCRDLDKVTVFRIPYSVFRIPYSVFRIPYSVFHFQIDGSPLSALVRRIPGLLARRPGIRSRA